MHTQQQELITICLVDLSEKDQAVIQRVITFGASQGKPYALTTEASTALVTITLDNYPATISHGLHLRIGEPGLPCDLLIQRPLLVTRVMRALDDAAQLLKSRPQQAMAHRVTDKREVPSVETTSITPQQTVIAPETLSTVIPANTPVETLTASSQDKLSISPALSAPSVETSSLSVVDHDENRHDDYHYTALVVDDSAAIRKQLELELRDAQIRADFAETGEEALEKSAQKQYDIIFLDIILPGIDGYEVCRQMRIRKNMKKTPIIMLSGKTSPLDEVKGVIAGASTYLTKPVKREQFQQTLQRVSKWLTNFAC